MSASFGRRDDAFGRCAARTCLESIGRHVAHPGDASHRRRTRRRAEEADAGEVTPDGFAERWDEATIQMPGAAVFKKGGFGRIKATHSEGGADLVIEIVSRDSRERDRGRKLDEYERAGVEEYWIVDPERRRAEFHRLREGAYEPVLPDEEGRVHSSTLPGFYLRVAWLWNRPKVLNSLRELGVV